MLVIKHEFISNYNTNNFVSNWPLRNNKELRYY